MVAEVAKEATTEVVPSVMVASGRGGSCGDCNGGWR